METQFLAYLNNENVVGCANTWCQNNVFLGGTLPTILTPSGQSGDTFVYYIYIGLGYAAAPVIPSSLYSITIPIQIAQ